MRFANCIKYSYLILNLFTVMACAHLKPQATNTPMFGDQVRVPSSNLEYIRDKGSGPIVIPFEFFRGDMRMKVVINNKPAYFLLDNGSLWDELMFFGSPKVDSLGLAIVGEQILGDSTADHPIILDVAEEVDIDFGEISFVNQPAVITRYIPDLPNPWEGADGQISGAFFKNFVVKIDFDEMQITLSKPRRCEHAADGYTAKMKQGPFDSRLIEVEIITIDKPVSLDLLIDLGGIFPLYLPLGTEADIQLPQNAREEILGIGFDNPDVGYVGRVAEAKIGPYRLSNVEAAFKLVPEGQVVYGEAMIGMSFLKRFNIIFDYPCEQITLVPNNAYPTGGD